MPCTAITAIVKGCDNNMGGIRKVWIFDMSDVTGLTEAPTTWTIDAINVAEIPVGFEFNRNTGNYTEEAAIDPVNGSSFVTQTINLVFSRREALKSKSIKILGEGQRYLGALVLDANGLYTMFFDLQLTATGEGSGTAKADGSKYSVVLSGESEFLAKYVLEADATAFITTGIITV